MVTIEMPIVAPFLYSLLLKKLLLPQPHPNQSPVQGPGSDTYPLWSKWSLSQRDLGKEMERWASTAGLVRLGTFHGRV